MTALFSLPSLLELHVACQPLRREKPYKKRGEVEFTAEGVAVAHHRVAVASTAVKSRPKPAKRATLEYIQAFYDRWCRHSNLGYMSCAEFEAYAETAALSA